MKHQKEAIEAFLTHHNVDFKPLVPSDFEEMEQLWLETFAKKVKKATGAWIYHRFRWHGFSAGFQACLEGPVALDTYLKQWPAPYVIFDEESAWAYKCNSQTYLDFTEFGADIYVAHHNMKWTMAFTHEQPHDGPYFATKAPS